MRKSFGGGRRTMSLGGGTKVNFNRRSISMTTKVSPGFKVTSGAKGTTTTFTTRAGGMTVSSITRGMSSFTRLFSKKR